MPNKGNTAVEVCSKENKPDVCGDRESETFDMLTPQMGAIDMRLFFHERPATDWS
jgi:hypothetical protein